MRFLRTDEAAQKQRERDQASYHPWFAWRPVRTLISPELYAWAWLEVVLRRRDHNWSAWKYKAPTKPPKPPERASYQGY